MTKWAEDETEFTVRISPNSNGAGTITYLCRIPKPVMKMLGKPDRLTFVVEGRKRRTMTVRGSCSGRRRRRKG